MKALKGFLGRIDPEFIGGLIVLAAGAIGVTFFIWLMVAHELELNYEQKAYRADKIEQLSKYCPDPVIEAFQIRHGDEDDKGIFDDRYAEQIALCSNKQGDIAE